MPPDRWHGLRLARVTYQGDGWHRELHAVTAPWEPRHRSPFHAAGYSFEDAVQAASELAAANLGVTYRRASNGKLYEHRTPLAVGVLQASDGRYWLARLGTMDVRHGEIDPARVASVQALTTNLKAVVAARYWADLRTTSGPRS